MAQEQNINQNSMLSNQNVTSLGRPLVSEIFTRFSPDDVISGDRQVISRGLWSSNVGTLTSFYTSSTQAAATSSRYYLSVYTYNPQVSSSAEVQFQVAYGHRAGSGSTIVIANNNDTPTRAIYSQYRNLLLDPSDTTFTFGSQTSDDIYAVTFQRSLVREKLDPGNWQLNISGSTAASTIHLIDDSAAATDSRINAAGRIFNIVSGTITNGVVTAVSSSVYGLCYPDLGILVFNARMLHTSASLNVETGSTAVSTNNNFKLYRAISASNYFAARSEEEITSTHYFVRVKNSSYNFSNNPTFITGSYGQIKHTDFIGDPKVYITTIGLYNDPGDLLAVAKMSQPILKSFTREALIRVKLDW